MKEKIYIKIESVLSSWLKDLFTFECLLGLLLFNYKILNGDWYVTIFLLIIWFLGIATMSSFKKFSNKEEAIDYLSKMEK